MKKRILLITVALALILVVACFASCADNNAQLNTINKLLDVQYSKVVINVTTEMDGEELKGEYTLTFNGDVTNIEFSYDVLNELSFNGDNNEFKKTVSGTAVVQDGVVISDNQEADLNTAQLQLNGFNFKQAYFKNVKSTSNDFEADVVNPGGFLGGTQLNVSDMSVKVTYFSSAIVQISLNYLSSEGATVAISYKFSA